MKYKEGKWYRYSTDYFIRCNKDSDGYPFHYSEYISGSRTYTKHISTLSSDIHEEVSLELVLPHLPKKHKDKTPIELLLTTIL